MSEKRWFAVSLESNGVSMSAIRMALNILIMVRMVQAVPFGDAQIRHLVGLSTQNDDSPDRLR